VYESSKGVILHRQISKLNLDANHLPIVLQHRTSRLRAASVKRIPRRSSYTKRHVKSYLKRERRLPVLDLEGGGYEVLTNDDRDSGLCQMRFYAGSSLQMP
jgi:hypothetical protein